MMGGSFWVIPGVEMEGCLNMMIVGAQSSRDS